MAGASSCSPWRWRPLGAGPTARGISAAARGGVGVVDFVPWCFFTDVEITLLVVFSPKQDPSPIPQPVLCLFRHPPGKFQVNFAFPWSRFINPAPCGLKISPSAGPQRMRCEVQSRSNRAASPFPRGSLRLGALCCLKSFPSESLSSRSHPPCSFMANCC